MKIEIEKINWNGNKEELLSILSQLPKWRQEQALSLSFDIDKYLCAKSFLLLMRMLFDEYNLKTIPPFSYKTNGKPYFKEYPDICFNISHCKSGIACVVNDKPVGIDIEEFYFDKDVAKKVLSEAELEAVQKSNSPKQEFIKIWTMKESYLKLTGVGIVEDIKSILNCVQEGVNFKTFLGNSFISTVAFNNINFNSKL